jgi:periplasmic divalent cation tolerance protein
MTPLRIVFSTIDREDRARTLAQQLVQENLAACVTIVSSVNSIYKWKGTLEESTEWLLVVKTSETRLAELMSRVRELHPYEVPEIIAFPIDAANAPYLEWALGQMR